MVDEERADVIAAISELRDDLKCMVTTVNDHEKRLTIIETGLAVQLTHIAAQIAELKEYWAKAIFIMLLALVGLAGGPRLVEVIAKVLGGV
jgi:hypothetical protein